MPTFSSPNASVLTKAIRVDGMAADAAGAAGLAVAAAPGFAAAVDGGLDCADAAPADSAPSIAPVTSRYVGLMSRVLLGKRRAERQYVRPWEARITMTPGAH